MWACWVTGRESVSSQPWIPWTFQLQEPGNSLFAYASFSQFLSLATERSLTHYWGKRWSHTCWQYVVLLPLPPSIFDVISISLCGGHIFPTASSQISISAQTSRIILMEPQRRMFENQLLWKPGTRGENTPPDSKNHTVSFPWWTLEACISNSHSII